MPPTIGKCRPWSGHATSIFRVKLPMHYLLQIPFLLLLLLLLLLAIAQCVRKETRPSCTQWGNNSVEERCSLPSTSRDFFHCSFPAGLPGLPSLLCFVSCRSNSYNLSRMGGGGYSSARCICIFVASLAVPLNWNRKFINKLCLLLINQSEVQHSTQQQAVQIAVSVAVVVVVVVHVVAAVSVEHLCGAHWHVAHVRWAGPAGECVALSTACCSFAYGKKTDMMLLRGGKVSRGTGRCISKHTENKNLAFNRLNHRQRHLSFGVKSLWLPVKYRMTHKSSRQS